MNIKHEHVKKVVRKVLAQLSIPNKEEGQSLICCNLSTVRISLTTMMMRTLLTLTIDMHADCRMPSVSNEA